MLKIPPLDKLASTQFKNDPRVLEAKKLILEALKDHQRQFNHIKPPQLDLKQGYTELLEVFSQYRGGKLYFPYIGSGFGRGALVELLDGSVKYDMISGIGPHYWGHNHPDLLEVNLEAALADTVMQGHLQQNLDAIELSSLLIHASNMNHCFLSSSGAMANENALKIAFQKRAPANRLLAFEKCFMGRTIALSQITDKPTFREGLPSNLAVDYIPFYQSDYSQESIHAAVHVLKKYLNRYPKQHAAMCFELIQGEGGFNVGSQEFFEAMMRILKEHDITVIVDEIQTFGRTSSLFAYQYFDLDQYVDIVTIGKLSQVCATLFRSEFKPRPGLLSQTFTSSTMALHASKYIINALLHGDYLGSNGKIMNIHHAFLKHFKRLEQLYPHLIKGPYGIGAMLAFTPYDGETHRVTRFIHRLFEAGVISFIAGTSPSRVRFLVPIGAITETDVDHVMQIVEKVLKQPETD